MIWLIQVITLLLPEEQHEGDHYYTPVSAWGQSLEDSQRQDAWQHQETADQQPDQPGPAQPSVPVNNINKVKNNNQSQNLSLT
jgi:hypothetical protein